MMHTKVHSMVTWTKYTNNFYILDIIINHSPVYQLLTEFMETVELISFHF